MSFSNNYPTVGPVLNLDFINNEALDPRVTFTRASTATYYNGVTTAVAEQNLLLQSQDFATTWTASNTSVSANSVTAPDGTNTADTLTGAAGSGLLKRIFQSPAIPAATCTFSVFAKAGTHNFIQFFYSGTGATTYANFDISTGTAGNFNGVSSSITAVGNGWYRCTHTFVANNTSVNISLVDSNTAARGATTSTTNDVYLWGAQLEQRSAATAYTATTTQPITNYIPVLLTAQNNVPRFDHNPTTGVALGLLIEEQRTNLLLQSEDFATTWVKTRSSITANTIVAPDGTLTGDKLVEDTTASDTHFVNQSVAVVNPNQYTVSVFLKAAERNIVDFITASGTATFSAISVNLTNGTIGAPITAGLPSAVSTSTINFVGNGWYRVTMQFVGSSTGFSGCQVRLSDGASTTYTGDGYSGIFIWGAQLEAGAFATSYIPTTTTALTRSADVASMTGTNFSSWYNASEGTVYSESLLSRQAAIALTTVASINNGTDGSLIANFYRATGNTGTQVLSSGATQADLNNGIAITANTIAKIAAAYKVNDFAMSTNAGTVQTDTSGIIPVVNQFTLGNAPSWANLNGHIQRIAYYNYRVPNAQLQALTGA